MKAHALAVLALLALASLASAAAPEKIPIIFDTDIGTDIDDSFALALVLTSPELDLRGVTTVSADAYGRALIACRMLWLTGHGDVPVAAGRPPQAKPMFQGQYQYGLRATGKHPVKESAVEFMYAKLKAEPGKITLLTVGDLTNVAQLITAHPDCKPWIKRVVLMGGAVRVGYNGKPPVVWEWNIKSDIKGAQTVFASGIPLVVAPLDATLVKLEEPWRKKIFDARTPLTYQLLAHYQLWDKQTPTLFDPVAVTLAFNERFCTMEDLRLEVDDQAVTREIKGGKPNARVATAIKTDEFLKWYVERVTAGTPAPVTKEPTNVSAPVAQGVMPYRVHAIEDFETDIERRWWLAGKLETKNVPPGSTRACRGVICNNFDGQMGEKNASYTTVIFNPVPGPPMGKNTRLSFRCWLKGTDTLRVQLYTLSKGYHRHLTLTKLPQEKWEALTVDMTAMRRPDGSGGPLAEDERIDDIQFYADPAAELLIDDIVLYDAAPDGETAPFPKRILFTAGFDTGAQGKEWPGDFTIVPKEKPLTWKAAQSVLNPKTDFPWMRVHLRGEQPLGDVTRFRFQYHLTDSDSMRVILNNRTAKDGHVVELKGLKRGAWAETTVDFTADSRRADGSAAKPQKGDKVDEIQFLLPKGATLLVDDLLLYEPGVK